MVQEEEEVSVVQEEEEASVARGTRQSVREKRKRQVQEDQSQGQATKFIYHAALSRPAFVQLMQKSSASSKSDIDKQAINFLKDRK